MLRNRGLILLGGCFLAASAAWADDTGFVDCTSHPEATEVFAKARKTREVVASLACGERFTVIQNGFIFSRIQTADGKVGFVYSNLITAGAPQSSGQQPAAASTLSSGRTSSAPSSPTPAGNIRGAVISGDPAAIAQAQTAAGQVASSPTAAPSTAATMPAPAPISPPSTTAAQAPSAAVTTSSAVQPNPSTASQPQSGPAPSATIPTVDKQVPAVQSSAPAAPAAPTASPAPASNGRAAAITGVLPPSTILTGPQTAADQPPAQSAPQTPAATSKAAESVTPTTATSSSTAAQPQPAPAASSAPASAPAPTAAPISTAPETPAPAEQPASAARADAEPAPIQPATPVVHDTSSWEKPNPGGGRRVPLIELFGGYSFARLNGSGGSYSNMNGALGSIGWNVKPWLQLVADSSYNYVTASGTKIVLYGNHWGPRVFLRGHGRWRATPFVEGLFGGSRADTTVTGTPTTSENVFSFKVGGGLDIKPLRHVEIRVLDVDYYRTAFGGAHQTNYWASTGIVIRLFEGNSE